MDLKSIIKNSTSLLSGVVGAQVINIAVTPILTRLFSPDEIGQLAVFTSFALSFVILATLKYEFAIPTAKDYNTAKNLAFISVLLLTSFSAIVMITGIFLPQLYTAVIGVNQSLVPYLFLGVLSVGVYTIASYWQTREEKFGRLAISKVMVSIIVSVVSILSGIFGHGVIGLAIAYLLGRIVAFIYIFPISIRPIKIRSIAVKETALEYIDYPRYTALASFVNIIGTQSSPLVFALFYSSKEIGLFSLGMRIIVLPAQIISQSLGQVIYSFFSKKEEVENERFIDLVNLLFTISLPIFTIMNLVGGSLFELVFGDNWYTAGFYASIMSLWLIFSFVSAPLSHLAYVKRKNKSALGITIVETPLRLVSIVGGYYLGGMKFSVICFTVAGIVITTFYIWWIFSLYKVSPYLLLGKVKLKFILYFGIIVVNYLISFGSIYLAILIVIFSIIDLTILIKKLGVR